MSDNNSEDEADASAELQPHSLVSLRAQELKLVVNEDDWHDQERPDFHHRTVSNHYQFHPGIEGTPRALVQPGSPSSSMAAASIQSHRTTLQGSTYSGYSGSSVEPPLSYSTGSTIRSSSSARTDLVDDFLPNNTLVDEDGVLEVPAATLACPFGFLGCRHHFEDLKEWNTHYQSHFRRQLPVNLACPFRHCIWKASEETGTAAWHQQTVHISSQHRGDAVDTVKRPHIDLLRHLWGHRIIDNAELKELREHGRLTDRQIFLRTAGQTRDRRQERPRDAVRPRTSVAA